MDIIYCLDRFICRIVSRFGFCSPKLTQNYALLRHFRRESTRLIGRYVYPSSLQQSDKVWIFWAQGKNYMPLIVKRCYESVLANKGNFDVVLLDMKDVKKYVDIPDYIHKKVESKCISLTHFSDILRFSLLAKYGGYYLDATIFLAHSLPMINGLFTIRHPYSDEYISQCQWTGFLWYMPVAHPLALFLRDYLLLYWKRNDKLRDYFIVDYIIRVFSEKNREFAEELNSLPISNPDLYFFQSPDCEAPYRADVWDEIKENTLFFKNSWKKDMLREQNGITTFYGKLIGGNFNE